MYIPRHWSTPLPTASLLCSVPQTCPQPAPWSLPDSKHCFSWRLTPPRRGRSITLKHQGLHFTEQKAATSSFLSPAAGKIYGSCSSPPRNSALESSMCWSRTVTRGKEREVWISFAQPTLTCLLSFWRTFSLQITLINAPLNNTYSILYKTAPFTL